MVHANIAFGELAPHVPESDIDNTVLMLIAILADVPHIDFEPSLSWQGMLDSYSLRLSLLTSLQIGPFLTKLFTRLYRHCYSWPRPTLRTVQPSWSHSLLSRRQLSLSSVPHRVSSIPT